MEENKEKKNWLEGLITIISGILVLFTLGFLVYQMIYKEETPPNILVFLGEVLEKDSGYAIPIKAENQGTETAENVIIEVILINDTEPEKAEITFAFLPGNSSVMGWVIFTQKPKASDLTTHVKGYGIP